MTKFVSFNLFKISKNNHIKETNQIISNLKAQKNDVEIEQMMENDSTWVEFRGVQ